MILKKYLSSLAPVKYAICFPNKWQKNVLSSAFFRAS